MLEWNTFSACKGGHLAGLSMCLISTRPKRDSHRPAPPQEDRRAARSRSAFTLVELAIVVMIMSVLVAVAVPTFFDSLLFHRVESAARRVKSDLELARKMARLTSSTRSVSFTGSVYTLAAIKALDHPNDVYSVDLAAAPFELDTVNVDFNGSTSVSFDGYGTPSDGGSIVLKSKELQCTVTLDGVTGDVTITSGHSRGRTAKVAPF
jgi:prepilin-type N-terminal cleavage/methylation domain-containing protein